MLLCRVGAGRRCIYRANSRSLSQKAIPRHELLTLLHKTTSLLPQVLGAPPASVAEAADFWKEVLSETYDDLVSTDIRPAKITVYGLDEWSGAQDLVTALLMEPLTSDESLNQQIRTRWNDYSSQRSLTLSTLPVPASSSSQITSSFFQRFVVPLQIIELSPPPVTPLTNSPLSFAESDERVMEALLKADVSVIICNPVTTPLADLFRQPSLFYNPNTILVLSSAASAVTAESLESLISGVVSEKTSRKPKVLFADPSRAVIATEAFILDSRSSSSVQRYQDDFVGSRVSTVTGALKGMISSGSKPSETTFRSQMSHARIRTALSAYQAALRRARNEMDSILVDVRTLKAKIEEDKARIQGAVFHSLSKTEGDIVVNAIQNATKEVKSVMDRLTWWRMTWRIDELSFIVIQAVQQAWCRDLERQLILHTGRLSVLQDDTTRSMLMLLESHSTPPFNSAVLQNSLRQLVASPSAPLSPDVLAHPINIRRKQIIEYPTMQLHTAAQRAVLGMSGGIAAGAGISWAGWFGWLTGSGEGLLGAVGLDAGTAIGVGLLSAIAGVRWAVSSWERSKRRWWEDWDRVGQGLGRDLRVNLDEVIRDKVLVVAQTGCDTLSGIIAQRRVELEEIEKELDLLKTTSNTIEEES